MFDTLKRLLVGRPLDSSLQHNQRLSKRIALAVFSSDALSSVAYATEAILVVLITAGAAGLPLVVEISAGIVLLLAIVGFSYRQTIHAYPNGGGAYIVAHENLGQTAGLIAAASLMIDYVLTVAVSVSAGVFAITSLANTWGYTWLSDYSVPIALVCIAIISIINLRGVKESGIIFAVPTYVFIISIFGLVVAGAAQVFGGGTAGLSHPAEALPAQAEALSLFLILKAFAAGCTALTGVEAISNGVPAFKPSESQNASRTLLIMIGILGFMFLGTSVLASSYRILPREDVSVVSQIATQIVGTGPAFFLIQVATALILVLAANTAFADFPRLASLLANDRFLPRQFSSRGDRLVFSNGILILALFAAMLVVVFRAKEQAMLPLYAIGVFISFTLSQAGMVIHWRRLKGTGWQRNAAINGLGAVLTAVVLGVIVLTKFTQGAWIVLLVTPVIVLLFRAINHHYLSVAAQLSLDKVPEVEAVRRHTAIVPISGVHRGVIPALAFARSLAPDNVTALYVDLDPAQTQKIQEKWARWGNDIPLAILPSPYRSLIRPILTYIDTIDDEYSDDMLSVILPEFVPAHWWEHLLHNQTALALKAALFLRRQTVVISVPYHLD